MKTILETDPTKSDSPIERCHRIGLHQKILTIHSTRTVHTFRTIQSIKKTT